MKLSKLETAVSKINNTFVDYLNIKLAQAKTDLMFTLIIEENAPVPVYLLNLYTGINNTFNLDLDPLVFKLENIDISFMLTHDYIVKYFKATKDEYLINSLIKATNFNYKENIKAPVLKKNDYNDYVEPDAEYLEHIYWLEKENEQYEE